MKGREVVVEREVGREWGGEVVGGSGEVGKWGGSADLGLV